jgi:hypothetical protein
LSPEAAVPSPEYTLIESAMRNEEQIHATYAGYRRELCVHEIGLGPNGNEQILAYQFGGDGSKGPAAALPEQDRWRCMPISGLTDIEAVTGQWFTGSNRGPGNTCIAVSHYAVYP